MKHQFDEREIAVRNGVMMRGFCILLGLLFADFVLKQLGVHWALGAWNSMVYGALAIAIVNIEYIMRGVYYKYEVCPKRHFWLMLALAIVFGFSVILNIWHFTLIEQGQLSMWGSWRIAFALFTLIGICGTVRAAVDIRKNRNEAENT